MPAPGDRLRAAALPGRTTSAAERLPRLPAPEVSFNYLGQLDGRRGDGGLRLRRGKPSGRDEPAAGRPLRGRSVRRGRTAPGCTGPTDPSRHERAPSSGWRAFLAELAPWSPTASRPEAGGFTPSDFPLARLDQAGARPDLLARPRRRGPLPAVAPRRRASSSTAVRPRLRGLCRTIGAPSRAISTRLPSRRPGGGSWSAMPSCAPPSFGRGSTVLSSGAAKGPPSLSRKRIGADLTRPEQEVRAGSHSRPRAAASTSRRPSMRWPWSAPPPGSIGLLEPPSPPARRLVLRQLLAELMAAFTPSGRAAEPSLPPPRPYRDYIAWLAGRDVAEAERTGGSGFEGFTAPTPVPFDRGRPGGMPAARTITSSARSRSRCLGPGRWKCWRSGCR